MRCARAQKMMTAALDGELDARRRRALDAHVAGCPPCRRELAATERTLAALEALTMEAAVGDALMHSTLRRARLAAAEEAEGAARAWWRAWLPLPAVAVATAVVALLTFGVFRYTGEVPGPTGMERAPTGVARSSSPPAPARTARASRPGAVEPPTEPPPDLAAAPGKFIDLPILRNLDKLEHFEAIQTTTLDDEPATPDGEPEPSNG
jgi:anti-sigma factor RsiW